MLYAFGFIGLFTIGGLTGLFLAALGIDVHVHDTYFVVAHFHYIMVGGAIMGYLGGLHYWWPKITGRLYPRAVGQVRGAAGLRRLQPDVLPAVPAGYLGMPRRYHAYPPEFQVLTCSRRPARRSSAVGYLLPLIYLTCSVLPGRRRPPIRGAPGVSSGRPRRRRPRRTSR